MTCGLRGDGGSRGRWRLAGRWGRGYRHVLARGWQRLQLGSRGPSKINIQMFLESVQGRDLLYQGPVSSWWLWCLVTGFPPTPKYTGWSRGPGGPVPHH
uniref:Uncharacterized protein n=1 Tax=Crocodylus porosus TaxID=8502 RepID=A0A7M4EDQ4_CROPO